MFIAHWLDVKNGRVWIQQNIFNPATLLNLSQVRNI